MYNIKRLFLAVALVLFPIFSYAEPLLNTIEEIKERTAKNKAICNYDSQSYKNREATKCFYDLQIASSDDLNRIEFLRSSKEFRLSLISKVKLGIIGEEEAKKISKQRILKKYLGKTETAKLTSEWAIRALVGDKEIETNLKYHLLYHSDENKCKASVKLIEKTLEDSLHNMPIVFFCKPNPAKIF